MSDNTKSHKHDIPAMSGKGDNTKSADPRAIQWASSGNMLDGIPGQMSHFLASADGITRGWGYGPGWSMMFGTEYGDITVEAGQWVTREDDGTFTVSWERPEFGFTEGNDNE